MMASTLYSDNKTYMIEALESMSIWKNMDTWESLIYISIEDEIDKSGIL